MKPERRVPIGIMSAMTTGRSVLCTFVVQSIQSGQTTLTIDDQCELVLLIGDLIEEHHELNRQLSTMRSKEIALLKQCVETASVVRVAFAQLKQFVDSVHTDAEEGTS